MGDSALKARGFVAPKFSKVEEFQKRWSLQAPTLKERAYLLQVAERGLVPKGCLEDGYVLSINPKVPNELIFENDEYRFTLPYGADHWLLNQDGNDRPAKPQVSNYMFHWVCSLLEKFNVFAKHEVTSILGSNREN